MDLKVYYSKIREAEATIEGSDVVVVSYETPDGGKAGTMTEVPKHLAAKLLVEGRARLASQDEVEEFREKQRVASQTANDALAASRIRVAIVPDSEVRPRKGERKS